MSNISIGTQKFAPELYLQFCVLKTCSLRNQTTVKIEIYTLYTQSKEFFGRVLDLIYILLFAMKRINHLCVEHTVSSKNVE